jgi:phosphoglycolate phosphatase-like HAD superfamily hydrolase
MAEFEYTPPSSFPYKDEILCDFDGVLADSFETFVQTANEILGKGPVNPDELEYLRGLSVFEIKEYFHLNAFQLFQLFRKGRREITKKMDDVQMFTGMETVVKELSESGRNFYIVSSNATSTIENFIERNNLSDYITDIYGDIGVTGKARGINKVLNRRGLEIDNSLYIGDEVRDILATRKIGMQCIATAWGYNTRKALAAYHPTAIADTPEQLGKLLRV